jgi:hypothetical protein
MRRCVVTFACIGFASRLNQAIDDTETFTPLDSQPCQLLTLVFHRLPGYRVLRLQVICLHLFA